MRGTEKCSAKRLRVAVQERSNRRGERRRIARRHGQSTLADQPLGVADIGGDGGQTARHALGQGIGKTLAERRARDDDVARRQQAVDIVAPAEAEQAIDIGQLVGALADRERRDAGKAVERLDESEIVLHRIDAADDGDQRRIRIERVFGARGDQLPRAKPRSIAGTPAALSRSRWGPPGTRLTTATARPAP